MNDEVVRIVAMSHVTHDMLQIVTEKPAGANFLPGQATELAVNKKGWAYEKRPFTFTCRPEEDFLEFMIKTYPSRQGVTNQLLHLKAGDELIINDIFGAIEYRGEGTFIAGGAGITPFIAILRDLNARHETGKNRLIFANKTKADIVLHSELRAMLGEHFINILSAEDVAGYAHGHVSESFIKDSGAQLDGYFYLCAPPPMMDAVAEQLAHLKVPPGKIITEAF